MTDHPRLRAVTSPGYARAISVLVGLFAFMILGWLAKTGDAWSTGFMVTGQQHDYYNLLVDGMLDGQLSLKVDVTYAPPDNAPPPRLPEPYLLDAGFHDGRYYLYYGAVPAVAIMLPYTALTGHDLATNVVVLVLVGAGYLASLAAYRRLHHAYFPDISLAAHGLFVITLGWGAAQPFLVARGAFYEVPEAGAYACVMAAAWALAALHTRGSRPVASLALASLAMGLAVGCRPVVIFALPGLALPAWQLYRARRRQLSRIALALLGPSAAVGVVLALYNYARFGSPVEFGFRYGLNSFFASDDPLYSWRFVWPNLVWYFGSLPSLSPYFPFFFPVSVSFPPEGYHGVEAVHGQIWLPLAFGAALIGGFTSAEFRAKLSQVRGWLLTLLLMALPPLGFLLILTVRGNRYLADFQPALLLALITVLGLLFGTSATFGVVLMRRIAGGIVACGLVATLGSAIQQFDQFKYTRPIAFERLESWPARTACHLGLLTYGPIAFDVTFPPDPAVLRVEPLLTIGLPGYADTLVVTHRPGNVVEFHLNNNKLGGPRSAQRRIESGRPYRFTLETGAFYPPVSHNWGDGRSRTQRAAVKYQAIVTLDGETIINAPMHSNDAPPWTITLGRNTINAHLYSTHFSGKVTNLRRLSPTPPVLAPLPTDASTAETFLAAGWFTLDLEPPVSRQTPYPLLATGQSGAGNLLSIIWVNDTTFELALDTWGYGYSRSGPLPLPTDGRLQLDIVIPSLLSAAPLAADAHRDTLQVWLGSSCIWQLRVPAYLDTFPAALIGANAQGFSTGAAHYAGNIQRLPNPPATLADRLPAVLDLPPPTP